MEPQIYLFFFLNEFTYNMQMNKNQVKIESTA